MNHVEETISTQNISPPVRKPYRKPLLEPLGDLRTLTLGGSPGSGDYSGNIYSTQSPPPPV